MNPLLFIMFALSIFLFASMAMFMGETKGYEKGISLGADQCQMAAVSLRYGQFVPSKDDPRINVFEWVKK